MNYEEKYKEALKAVKELREANPSDDGIQNWVNEKFPELFKDEDEKIRKEIKQLIQGMHDADPRKERWLTWLEKQGTPKQVSIWKHWKDGIAGNGEGKPIYLVKIGNTYSLNSCLGFECDYIELSELDNLMLEKQGEQQHAWSEEDINKPNGGIVMEDFNDGNGFYKVNLVPNEEQVKEIEEQVKEIEELVKRWGLQPKGDEDESIISDLLDYFDEDKCLKHEVNDIVKWLKTIKLQQKKCGENEIKMLDNLITYLDGRKDLLEEIKRTYINFLKSLKQRMGWKPSDEQMKALHDMNLTGNISYAGQGQTLIELYNDLKKL